MEETWELFARTGRVTDYLEYCREREKETNGRAGRSDRHGAYGHANQ